MGKQNVKYGVRSPKFVWALVHSYTHWLRHHNPPSPHLGSCTRALLVSQDRRHLLVTLWFKGTVSQIWIARKRNIAEHLYRSVDLNEGCLLIFFCCLALHLLANLVSTLYPMNILALQFFYINHFCRGKNPEY
jgi:hypothetical protein